MVLGGWLVLAGAGAGRLRAPGGERDRGDVPGWVLVTVMTAGLVAALGIFARKPLEDAFTHALSLVTGGGSSSTG